jgi:hypothetical protein
MIRISCDYSEVIVTYFPPVLHTCTVLLVCLQVLAFASGMSSIRDAVSGQPIRLTRTCGINADRHTHRSCPSRAIQSMRNRRPRHQHRTLSSNDLIQILLMIRCQYSHIYMYLYTQTEAHTHTNTQTHNHKHTNTHTQTH